MQVLATVLLLATAWMTWGAQPIKLPTLRVGSTVYSNVTVLSATASDLYIEHQHGVASLKLRYVEPGVQKLFGYDSKAAHEAEKKVQEHNAQFAATIAAPARSQGPPVRSSEASVADPVTPASLLNKPAPPFKSLQWLVAPPAGATNQVTLVYFWEPWSFPAKRWLAALQALHQKFPTLLVLNISRSPELDQRASDTRPEGPQAVDTQGQFASAVGVSSVPHLLVIDAKGSVRYNGHPGGITEDFLRTLP